MFRRKAAASLMARVVMGMAVAMFSVMMGCAEDTGDEGSRSGRGARASRGTDVAPPAGDAIRFGAGCCGLAFGMSRQEIEECLGPPERVTGSALEYPGRGLAVILSQARGVRVILCGSSNPGDVALRDAFTAVTAEGVGLGAPVGQVRAAYGEPDKRRAFPTGAVRLRYRRLGAAFTFLQGQLAHIELTPTPS